MAITLPLPVRIAAGVFATGLDRLRHLPQDLPALSVTVAGQAVRMSMRVQQEIAQLAGRGDELLAGITSRPTEHPAWATFDDEDGGADGSNIRVVDGTQAGPDDAAPDDDTPNDAAPHGGAPDDASDDAGPAAPPRRQASSPRASGSRPGGRPRKSGPSPTRRARAVAETATDPVTASPADPVTDSPIRAGTAPADPVTDPSTNSGTHTSTGSVTASPADPVTDSSIRAGTGPADPVTDPSTNSGTHTSTGAVTAGPTELGDGPADMPDYDQLRLTQVRARLRGLDAAAVARLLQREQLGPARAPFLTLLANRLTTLRSGDHRDPEA